MARLHLEIDSYARGASRLALCLLSLGTACLLLPGAARAGLYTARVRWAPSISAGVAEYEVYRRVVGGSYGAAESGVPSNSGGILSLAVRNLDVRTDYTFMVKAVSAAGVSAISNEVRIGYLDVAALVDSDHDGLTDAEEDVNLNRRVDPGESDPDRADSDGDGVGDLADACGGTAAGSAVNAAGCSCAQVSCDDGNACNGVETCSAGVCRAGTTPLCNDGNDCTTDTCVGGSCRHAAVANGSPCPDGNACNGAETCQGGTCAAGTALTCPSDGNPCTVESCDPASGCASRPAPDGTSCGDGDACNGAETCRGGACEAGAAPACDDGNPCTSDGCDPALGCVNESVADDTPCGPDRGFCAGTELCRAGACIVGAPPTCDDDNACTTDACDDALGRCTHQGRAHCCRTDADCADSDACTTAERCSKGTCVSTPLACPDAGACGSSRCDAAIGCLTVPVGDGALCDDGDACSTGDVCTAGACAGSGVASCPDPGPCAVGTCDPALGCTSEPLPDGTPCNDGKSCSKAGSCQAGVCRASSARSLEPVLAVQRFSMRRLKGGRQRLRGRATLTGGEAMRLEPSGTSLEIDDAAGAVLYRVDLAPATFTAKARPNNTRVALRRSPDARLRHLDFAAHGAVVRVRFTIVGTEIVPLDTTAVSLTMKIGSSFACASTQALSCTRGPGQGVTCASFDGDDPEVVRRGRRDRAAR